MKPVLKIQLQPDDLKKMRAFQSRKRAQKERRCIELFKKANRDFQRIVIMIIKKYQPLQVSQQALQAARSQLSWTTVALWGWYNWLGRNVQQ